MKLRLGVAVLLLLPATALAQGNPGPFGGLFGRTPERIGREFTALDFRASVGGQYDDAVFLDDAIPPEDVPQSGFTSGTNLGLAYQRQTDRLMLLATGGGTYQEFYQSPTFGATTYNAVLGARGEVTTRLSLEAQARYLRSPFFRLLPSFQTDAPAVVIPGDPAIVRLLENDNYDVSGGFVSRYAKHSTLRGAVAQRLTRFDGSGETFDVLRAEAHWSRQLTRSLALRAGYGRERILQSSRPDAEFVHELIDLGVDFARQLSLSQRTSFGFATQTSIVKRPLTGRRYRLNGSLNFSKYFGKTGHFAASLSRNTEFLAGFTEPLLSDAATLSVNGMLSPRLEWRNDVSGGRGRFGFEGTDDVVTSRFTSRLNYAMTRKFGVFTQYAVYYYRLPPMQTGLALLPQVSRQSFTIGINTWIPIINNLKVPRDPQ